MFKKKQLQNQPIVNTPLDYQEQEEIQDFPQYQPQPQPVQRQIQTQIQKRNEAVIIKAEVTENNTYIYVVETNYPLSLGICRLEQ